MSLNYNLNLVIAHKLEADPLVAYFKMNLIEKSPYTIYQGKEGIRLIVSGIGFDNAVSAVTFLAERQKTTQRPSAGWINIGIAGHQTADVGSIFSIDKVVYEKTGETYYPSLNLAAFASTELITLDQPELNYPKDTAYDMEGAGFFKSAMRVSTIEFVHSIKIISDNRSNPVEKITKKLITNLITQSCPDIEKFCHAIEIQLEEFNQIIGYDESYLNLFQELHFTSTQRYQFKRYCQRYNALSRQKELESISSVKWQSSRALLHELANNLKVKE